MTYHEISGNAQQRIASAESLDGGLLTLERLETQVLTQVVVDIEPDQHTDESY
jgi:hypothetical protein